MSTAVFGAPEFRARSGRTVKAGPDGSLRFGLSRGYIAPDEVFDAQEFFQAQRDIELGRWRWPENPDYVVYRRGDGLVALNESSGATRIHEWSVMQGEFPTGTILQQAIWAYVEAHPERKPWHDAKPEEVWLMGSGLHEFVALVGADGKFRFADGSDMAVTEEFVTGRRVWPEDAP